uniref:Putative ovule protein n=1 Tax=Solanum chacoense TaxID=4108 RepID=A0A0V0H2U6_SOLCH
MKLKFCWTCNLNFLCCMFSHKRINPISCKIIKIVQFFIQSNQIIKVYKIAKYTITGYSKNTQYLLIKF